MVIWILSKTKLLDYFEGVYGPKGEYYLESWPEMAVDTEAKAHQYQHVMKNAGLGNTRLAIKDTSDHYANEDGAPRVDKMQLLEQLRVELKLRGDQVCIVGKNQEEQEKQEAAKKKKAW